MKIFFATVLSSCVFWGFCIFSIFPNPAFSQETYPGKNGAYGGIDELGRVLSLQAPSPRKERYVGLFYFTWLAQHGKNGPYDITKIVAEHPEAVWDREHPGWGPAAAYHHWGESLFGYYTSDDPWVKRKHVQMLSDAGVDFLIFDATNAIPYLGQVLPLLSILEEYRSQGWSVPKVVFYTNSSSGATVSQIYHGIYEKGLYPELWFYWEGKPLIIAHPEECTQEIRDFFRIKKSQWPNENTYHADGFPWIAFERPQHVFQNEKGENEVINVSVAQHNGTIRMSSSAFYGDKSNWTRSFHEGENRPEKDAFKYGYNFAEQFAFAKKQDPKIIFFTGWNEWIAMRLTGPEKEPVMFVDLCDTNSSRDIEPMRGGFGDNYYMQFVEYVRQYKGIEPPRIFEKNPSVEIDPLGDFSQWEKVANPYRDYTGDTVDRDEPGYGELRYINRTGRNDFELMKVASDKTRIHFYVQTVKPITPPGEKHWMSLFLRIPNSTERANWEGYHFVLNRVPPKNDKAVLEGSKGDWNWAPIAEVPFRVERNRMQFSIEKRSLGLENGPLILEFKWADNYQQEGDIYSFYLDGDAAPIGRLNYVFQERF